MSRKSKYDHGGGAILRSSLVCAALVLAFTFVVAHPASAHDRKAHTGGIQAKKGNVKAAPFDMVHAKISAKGNTAIFHMAVTGRAGKTKPTPVGTLANSDVFAYVWPTSIDTSEVGFEAKAGILALAVTAHPDFDDTPLYDENGDGNLKNDGNVWHSHWVVLGPADACGEGALKVIDIPKGAKPRLPKTWPGLPILIDSPGWSPIFNKQSVDVRVPFDDIAVVENANYDGVTSGLRVNANIHAPLLCVVDVFDVASGDLSLPGRVSK
jgi:hypothetical protein